MRISEQSPKGVNGLSTLLVESEQFTPASRSAWAAVTPRMTLWSMCRPIRNRSVEGSTVSATPAPARRSAAAAKRAGSAAESLVTWPIATRPP